MRIIPMDNVSESSIGYYTRSDARATEPGDVWVCGVNTWGQNIGGFSMGTTGFGSCLNISSIVSVSAPYKLLTPTLQTNKILSFGNNEITLDDNVKINDVSAMVGNVFVGGILFKNLSTITSVNNGKTFGIHELLNGVIQVGGAANTIVTLPAGSAVYTAINTVLTSISNKSFEWSIINIGTFTCTLSTATATGHTIICNSIIISNTSARFITRLTAVNVAITYRIA